MIAPLRLVDELNGLHVEISNRNFELDYPSLKMVVITDNDKTYCLEVDLTGYPELMPSMYVLKELKLRNGHKMSTSASMHCLGTCKGRTKICHGNLSHWRPDTSFVKLYHKGKLWLEAYEHYLATGEPIDEYLKHQ